MIANACDPANEEEQAALEGIMKLPLADVLVQSAMHMQDTLLRGDTVALMRVVMAEAARFPHLAELAYKGFIVRLEDVATWMLSEIEETSGLNKAERQVRPAVR